MRFHHVNLAVHPDQLDAEIQFLCDGLGLRRVEPPPELADRARWYELPDGVQIHLSRTREPFTTDPGHVAVDVGDDLPAIEARLAAAGRLPAGDEGVRPGVRIVHDPAGHMWELRTSALARR